MNYYRIAVNCSDGIKRYVSVKNNHTIMLLPDGYYNSVFTNDMINEFPANEIIKNNKCEVEQVEPFKVVSYTGGIPSRISDNKHTYSIYRADLMSERINICKRYCK